MLKKWKVVFKTLSPIHIKGQRPDYGSGIVRFGRKGYIINEVKLSKFLKEKGLIESYVEYVSQCIRNRKKPFIVFFFNKPEHKISLDEITLKNISSRITSIGDGNTFICDGNGTYFVPGSSIKGAIRTSLIYHILNELKKSNKKEFDRLVIDTINRKLTEYNIAKKKYEWRKMEIVRKSFDETIITKEFQNFFNDLVKIAKVKKGPNTDFLRVLKISDSNKLSDIYRENVKVACFKNDGSFYFRKTKQRNNTEVEIHLPLECLRENKEFV
ncbi:MAG: type III-A CRISPR-associated RAMP protein Csm5, partial [Promethearchaeota archaeon]